MSHPMDHLGVSWPQLCARVETGQMLSRWAAAEPALAGYERLDVVADEVHDRSNTGRADVVLAALLRLAATDGGDDEVAASTVAWLLAPGARSLAVRLGDMASDVDAVVMSCLWLRIRTFPWRRRRRGYAKGVLLDTRKDVLAELTGRRPVAVDRRTVSTDPTLLAAVAGSGEESPSAMRELVDVLDWARAAAVVSGEDVVLLLQLVAAAEDASAVGGGAGVHGCCSYDVAGRVAQVYGVSMKTVLRRRDRVLSKLRQARGDYLAAVA